MGDSVKVKQLDVGTFLATKNGTTVGWGRVTSIGSNTNREIWAADAANFSPDATALTITKFTPDHPDCAAFKSWAVGQAAGVTITWFEHIAVTLAKAPC